jgi:GNAT superfamily N-acetyltransferase
VSEYDFLTIADQYWSTHLGIPVERLSADTHSIFAHGEDLNDYDGVFGLFRNGARAISIPSKRTVLLHPVLSKLPETFTPSDLAAALQPFAEKTIGPAFIGYLNRAPTPALPARPITPDDIPAVEALQHACKDADWEVGGSDVRLRTASGCFVGGQLASLAAYEVWGGTIAHIAIITHPGHRGRGLGTSAVAHLSARAIAAGLLPQYRTLDANHPSRSIAQSLGFLRYATSIAIRLSRST